MPTADDGIIAIGDCYEGGNSRSCLYKLSGSGVIEWQWRSAPENHTNSRSIQRLRDGRYAALLRSVSNAPPYIRSHHVQMFRQDGTTAEQRQLDDFGYADGTDIFLSLSSGDWLFGHVSRNQNLVLEGFDNAGELSMFRVLTSHNTVGQFNNHALELNDGRLFILTNNSAHNERRYVRATLLSSDGETDFSNRFDLINYHSLIASDVTRLDNGNIAIVGFAQRRESIVSDALLMMLASDGSLIWQRAIRLDGNQAIHSVTGLTSNLLAAAGHTETPEKSQSDYWYFTFTADGQLPDFEMGLSRPSTQSAPNLCPQSASLYFTDNLFSAGTLESLEVEGPNGVFVATNRGSASLSTNGSACLNGTYDYRYVVRSADSRSNAETFAGTISLGIQDTECAISPRTGYFECR